MNLRPKKRVYTALAVMLLSCSLNIAVVDSAFAQKASLEQCQKLQKKIARLTSLRRGGGNAIRMETWRQQRKRYEHQFREYRCRTHGKLLRVKN